MSATVPATAPVEQHKAAVESHLTSAKIPSFWLTTFTTIFLPILPSVVTLVLTKANDKVKLALRETRDVLVAADLGDSQ